MHGALLRDLPTFHPFMLLPDSCSERCPRSPVYDRQHKNQSAKLHMVSAVTLLEAPWSSADGAWEPSLAGGYHAQQSAILGRPGPHADPAATKQRHCAGAASRSTHPLAMPAPVECHTRTGAVTCTAHVPCASLHMLLLACSGSPGMKVIGEFAGNRGH